MSKKLTSFFVSAVLLMTLACSTKAQQFSDKEITLKTVDYKLGLKIDYEKEKIFANCQLSVLNPSEKSIRQIPLILYRLMKVKSVKNEKGEDLLFTQQVIAFEDWEQFQVNYTEVTLKSPVQQGEKRTIKIQYEGYLLGYSEVGMSYVKDRVDRDFTIIRPDCRAYPQVGYPSWKVNRAAGFQSFDYLINVTVPDSLTVANGGKLISKDYKNGWVTYTYQNIKPAWRMDIAIAKYGILEEKAKKMKIFHFQEDKEKAQIVLESMEKTMNLYSGWFGPLKDFQGFSIIEIPDGFGSQTDVTCIIQTESAFKEMDRLYELYHEISHIWNVKSLDPFPSRFESEGLAMFLQYLVQERLEGKKGALEKGADRARKSFLKKFENDSRCKDVPMMDYGKEMLTDLSYSKGMILFYVLYELVGEEQFMKIIGSFYQKFSETGATSEEFINHAKRVSEIDLTKFFQEWVYSSKSSEYIIHQVPVEEILKQYKQ